MTESIRVCYCLLNEAIYCLVKDLPYPIFFHFYLRTKDHKRNTFLIKNFLWGIRNAVLLLAVMISFRIRTTVTLTGQHRENNLFIMIAMITNLCVVKMLFLLTLIIFVSFAKGLSCKRQLISLKSLFSDNEKKASYLLMSCWLLFLYN